MAILVEQHKYTETNQGTVLDLTRYYAPFLDDFYDPFPKAELTQRRLNKIYELTQDIIKKKAKQQPATIPLALCDIGSYDGSYLHHFEEIHALDHIFAVDISKQKVNKALGRPELQEAINSQRLSIQVGDGTNLGEIGVRDGTFDIVTIIEVLRGLKRGSVQDLISESLRISTSRGITVITFADPKVQTLRALGDFSETEDTYERAEIAEIIDNVYGSDAQKDWYGQLPLIRARGGSVSPLESFGPGILGINRGLLRVYPEEKFEQERFDPGYRMVVVYKN